MELVLLFSSCGGLYFYRMGMELQRKTVSTGLKKLINRFPGALLFEIDRITAMYPERITPYYAELIQECGDPLWKQAVPDSAELEHAGLREDPLEEEGFSPIPGVVHRYPDRVLFLVSDICPVYCRFCTRKRRIGQARSREQLLLDREAGLQYISRTRSIRDVLLSGGDPLMLPEPELLPLLDRLFAIDRLDLVRIGTRALCTAPGLVTPELAQKLGRYRSLYINTHFNHSAELTPEAGDAAALLAEVGLPLSSQTVLLAGVNDDVELLERLFRGLLRMRVRPYYLHIMDLTQGTAHFRLPLVRVVSIYKELQRHLSGMALPRLMLDIPGGGGKISLDPGGVPEPVEGGWAVTAYSGERYFYPEVPGG